MAWTKVKTSIAVGVVAVLATGTTAIVVEKVVSSSRLAPYEDIFKHPDGSSMGRLEQTPPVLVIRPTRYPNVGSGIWTMSGKGVFVGASLTDLICWAYGSDPTRVILPEDVANANYDYLNTMPKPNDVLRDEIKKQFGLVARRETRETDIILLKAGDPARLNSFRTKGGQFMCEGNGFGNTQVRYFTNCPLSRLAEQDVEGYFEKPCINRADPKGKYDFAFSWQEPHGLSGEARKNALRPVIEERLNQLGLQLEPGREPIELLVVEKAK